MKKAFKLFGLTAIIMVFALLISCPSPGSSPGSGAGKDNGTGTGPGTSTDTDADTGDNGSKLGNAFTAYDEAGNKYTLTFNNGRSARAAGNDNNQGDDNSQRKKGDNYKITITGSDGNNKGSNTGKVNDVEGDGIITLQDDSGNFTVETTEDMDILRFPRVIKLDSGKLHEVNGHLSFNRQKVEIKEVTVTGNGLAEKLEWIKKNAQSNTRYTVNIDKNETLDGIDIYYGSPDININYLEYPRRGNVTVLLSGSNTISLTSNGFLFWIGSGVTLELEDVILQGKSSNDDAIVGLSCGAITMQGNSEITGNNGRRGGGGIDIYYGTLIMKDSAKIHNNTTSGSGGGVYLSWSTFTMKENAQIFKNTAEGGGGMLISSSTFIMQDNAKIYNNTAKSGGGIVIAGNSTFVMNGGEIYGNTATIESAGGVRLLGSNFTMNDGKIFNNTAYGAGGVSIDNYGVYTMNGGEIYGNVATGGSGGGIGVGANSYFRITDGVIYGSNEVNTALRNTANGSGNGDALYNSVPSYATVPIRSQYGKGSSWVDLPLTPAGYHFVANNTIKVINGVLQP
jgi:hypothetical protein